MMYNLFIYLSNVIQLTRLFVLNIFFFFIYIIYKKYNSIYLEYINPRHREVKEN